jgi:hypothetical protein
MQSLDEGSKCSREEIKRCPADCALQLDHPPSLYLLGHDVQQPRALSQHQRVSVIVVPLRGIVDKRRACPRAVPDLRRVSVGPTSLPVSPSTCSCTRFCPPPQASRCSPMSRVASVVASNLATTLRCVVPGYLREFKETTTVQQECGI